MSRIRTSFEKNCYTTNETAHAIIDVDNTACEGKVSSIIMRLIQNVVLNSGHHTYHRSHTVLKRHFGEIEPHGHVQGKQVEIDLNECKQQVYHENKSIDSDIELITDQMMQLAENIQPTTNSKCLTITYKLETLLEFEGTCCIDNPNCIIDMFLQPPYIPNYQVFQVPATWNPNVYDMKQLQAPTIMDFGNQQPWAPTDMNANAQYGQPYPANNSQLPMYPYPNQPVGMNAPIDGGEIEFNIENGENNHNSSSGLHEGNVYEDQSDRV